MKIEHFFEEFMRREYPDAGKLCRWWEQKKMEFWLKLPTGRGDETNKDFVEQIPDSHA